MDLTRGQRTLVLVGLAAVFIGIIILTVSRLDRARGTPVYPVAQSNSAPTGEVIVHVVGAVQSPGIYRVPAGCRVSHAVYLAGGLRGEADEASVNMAAVVVDGQQIVVKALAPVKTTEPAPAPVARAAAGPVPGPPAPLASPAPPVQPAARVTPPAPPTVISLNRATKPQLEALPSIGPQLAERILYYRYEHGPFRTVDDLLQVEGMGRSRLETVRPYLQP